MRYRIYRNKEHLIKDLIKNSDSVLDVGFWGQGIKISDENWIHNLILKQAKTVYGLDVDFDENKLRNPAFYKKGNAESFDFNLKFDVIFAGDLIEHLSNPGLFLQCASKHLINGGKIILTTPNCYNFFNMVEKISKYEPTVNSDHVTYFNIKTIKKLLIKNDFLIQDISYLYSLEAGHKESMRKKFLNIIYYLLSKITDKFIETIVIIATKNEQ
jgi:2-polyprenyl-3-methyl-5-hydroxy-6-metoxy-1,4-benzoquinol methylase